jgi:hypothetical protein
LPLCRGALAALRGQGSEGVKPLWSRGRGVVPRRERLRSPARVLAQGARISQHLVGGPRK